MVRWILVAALMPVAGAASPAEDCERALNLGVDLRRDVAELEAEVAARRAEADRLGATHRALYHDLHRVKRGLGWRERHLTAWLASAVGGNARERQAYVTQREDLATALRTLNEARAHQIAADRRVMEVIESWLNAHDPTFAALTAQESDLVETGRRGDACLGKIDEAINRVKSARWTDVVAGASDNKGVDLVAAYDGARANSAVAAVKASVADFGAWLIKLSHAGEALDAAHLNGVDVNLQIAIDFGTGTSFMDWYNAYKLGQTNDHLDELRTRVVAARADLVAARDRLLVEINRRLLAVRDAARVDRVASAPWVRPPP